MNDKAEYTHEGRINFLEQQLSKAQDDLKLAVGTLEYVRHSDSQLGFCLCPSCLKITETLKQIKENEG